MRWLIDGYNVMHAGGRLGPKLSRQGFQRARRRFLEELADALGPEFAKEATVVFDASAPPGDFGLDANHRGIGVLFALGDENADARIEQLIERHSNPKALTVVSSDRRVRNAASRRRARSLTADEFWDLIDESKKRKGGKSPSGIQPKSSVASENPQSPPDESAFWLETFGNIAEVDEIEKVFPPADTILSDTEIAEIERQIERES